MAISRSLHTNTGLQGLLKSALNYAPGVTQTGGSAAAQYRPGGTGMARVASDVARSPSGGSLTSAPAAALTPWANVQAQPTPTSGRNTGRFVTAKAGTASSGSDVARRSGTSGGMAAQGSAIARYQPGTGAPTGLTQGSATAQHQPPRSYGSAAAQYPAGGASPASNAARRPYGTTGGMATAGSLTGQSIGGTIAARRPYGTTGQPGMGTPSAGGNWKEQLLDDDLGMGVGMATHGSDVAQVRPRSGYGDGMAVGPSDGGSGTPGFSGYASQGSDTARYQPRRAYGSGSPGRYGYASAGSDVQRGSDPWSRGVLQAALARAQRGR